MGGVGRMQARVVVRGRLQGLGPRVGGRFGSQASWLVAAGIRIALAGLLARLTVGQRIDEFRAAGHAADRQTAAGGRLEMLADECVVVGIADMLALVVDEGGPISPDEQHLSPLEHRRPEDFFASGDDPLAFGAACGMFRPQDLHDKARCHALGRRIK